MLKLTRGAVPYFEHGLVNIHWLPFNHKCQVTCFLENAKEKLIQYQLKYPDHRGTLGHKLMMEVGEEFQQDII